MQTQKNASKALFASRNILLFYQLFGDLIQAYNKLVNDIHKYISHWVKNNLDNNQPKNDLHLQNGHQPLSVFAVDVYLGDNLWVACEVALCLTSRLLILDRPDDTAKVTRLIRVLCNLHLPSEHILYTETWERNTVK